MPAAMTLFRPLLLLIPVVMVLLCGSVQAKENRLALLIGNAAYEHAAPLRNTLNDARDLTADLESVGFKVTRVENTNLDRMIDAVDRFVNELHSAGGVGLLYYSGHGVQVDGRNYLVPIDAKIKKKSRIKYEAYALNDALSRMGGRGAGAVNLVILDACRDNPFSAAKSLGSKGLARVDAPESTLILYATKPGDTASDNPGKRNGLFTQYLRQAIKQPGLDVEQAFTQVVKGVYQESGRDQYPWKEGVLLDRFYFTELTAPVQLAGGSVTQVLPASGTGGILEVNSRPQGAEIHVDGIYAGLAPKRITDLTSGVHQVRAEKEGYAAEQKKVRVSAGDTLKLTLLLDAIASEPTELGLWVKPTPEDARVRILNIGPKYRDGIELKPGSYQLEVTAPGYQRHTHRFELSEGNQVYAVELEREETASPPVATSSPRRQSFEPEMVRIPGGCFQMGSPSSEEGRGDDERQHRVCVEGFKLAKYELTKGAFRRFVEATGYRTDAEKNAGGNDGCYAYKGGTDFGWKSGTSWRDPGFHQGDDEPAVCVSWNDANAYIDWLNRESGQGYRLPTEAEWEYAARAGSTSRFPFGDSEGGLCRYGNVADRSAKGKFSGWTVADCDDGEVFIADVGRYRANGYGLYDTLGNVWEWTCSVYDKGYGGGEKICTSNNDASDSRVLRGGSWINRPRSLRASGRSYWGADARGHIGFRLAQDL